MAKNKLTAEQTMDLVVTVTVCLAALLVLMTGCAYMLINPEQTGTFFGEFSIAKASGFAAPLLFLFMVLRLVYQRRRQRESAT